MLEAWMEAMEREVEVPVSAKANAWILAMPSSPTAMITSDTRTSMSLNPFMRCEVMCNQTPPL